MREADVIVLGAGPAGASLALQLARLGPRVALVERARFPRDKVCGEFVAPEGWTELKRLGAAAELERRGGRPIDRCRLSALDGRTVDTPLPLLGHHGRAALGISRAALDEHLVELCAAAGVDLLERCTALSPVFDNDRIRGVRIRPPGGAARGLELRGKLVVAADGRRSMIGRTLHPQLGDPLRSGPGSWFGLKVHLAPAGSRANRRVELHLFRDGYAGLAPIESERLNLCLLVTVATLRRFGGSPDRLLDEHLRRQPALGRVLQGAAPCSKWRSVGPLRFAPRRPASAGALFVGDAAGTIDPWSGEGIANALRGATLAAEFALRAVARGGLDGELSGEYAASWMRTFRPVTRRVRRIGWLFEHPRMASSVLAALGGPGRRLTPHLVATTRAVAQR